MRAALLSKLAALVTAIVFVAALIGFARGDIGGSELLGFALVATMTALGAIADRKAQAVGTRND